MDVCCHCSAGASIDQRRALESVERLLEDENVNDIALVATYNAIFMIVEDSPVADHVAAVLERGVSVYACAASMRYRVLEETRVLEDVERVSIGNAELVFLQDEGYAYLKVP